MAKSAIERRYQLAEDELKRKQKRQTQQEQEGMERRFAMSGLRGSDIEQKTAGSLQEEATRRNEETRRAFLFSKLGQLGQEEEIGKERAFSTGQREAKQAFQSAEQEAKRAFQGSEDEKTRGSATAERLAKEGAERAALEGSISFAASERQKNEAAARSQADVERMIEEDALKIKQDELDLNEIITFHNMGNNEQFANLLLEKWGIDLGAEEVTRGARGAAVQVPEILETVQRREGESTSDMLWRNERVKGLKSQYLSALRRGANAAELAEIENMARGL